MSFKTQKEIYEALLDGKKLIHKLSPPHCYVFLNDGHLESESGEPAVVYFDIPAAWSPYKEPKQMKTVKLYRYTYQQEKGSIAQSNWISQSTFWLKDVCKLLKTEEKTIKIEDV
ncbi:MAG: hypothetical protein ACK52I_21905 [Pseudomonadota bacterium]